MYIDEYIYIFFSIHFFLTNIKKKFVQSSPYADGGLEGGKEMYTRELNVNSWMLSVIETVLVEDSLAYTNCCLNK